MAARPSTETRMTITALRACAIVALTVGVGSNAQADQVPGRAATARRPGTPECSDSTSTPCFTSKTTGAITRTGTPGTSGQTSALAATLCIGRTDSSLINTIAGLPGPGALLLPARVEVSP